MAHTVVLCLGLEDIVLSVWRKLGMEKCICVPRGERCPSWVVFCDAPHRLCARMRQSSALPGHSDHCGSIRSCRRRQQARLRGICSSCAAAVTGCSMWHRALVASGCAPRCVAYCHHRLSSLSLTCWLMSWSRTGATVVRRDLFCYFGDDHAPDKLLARHAQTPTKSPFSPPLTPLLFHPRVPA